MAVLFLVFGAQAYAQVPTKISVQGFLEIDGEPVNDPSADLTLAFYEVATGGSSLWEESFPGTQILDGVFSVAVEARMVLGAQAPLWMGVRLGTAPEIQPRTALTSVPYALVARTFEGPAFVEIATAPPDAVLSVTNPGTGHGLQVPSAGGVGLDIGATGGHGVHVASSGAAGFRVDEAATNGLYVSEAQSNGLFIDRVGNPPQIYDSPWKDGIEIRGTEGFGIYIGYAGLHGVHVRYTPGYGFYVHQSDGYGMMSYESVLTGMTVWKAGNAPGVIGNSENNGFQVGGVQGNGLFVGWTGQDGLHVAMAGNPPVRVASAGRSGLEVEGAETHGVWVGYSGDDGLHVRQVGAPSTSSASGGYNGLEVEGAESYGVFVGRADQDGVNVASAGRDGMRVGLAGTPSSSTYSSLKDGFQVDGAEGHGLYVGRADADGVHVQSAGGWAGYFTGNLKATGDIWATNYWDNSDRRLKDKITPINHGLDDVLALSPVTYEWGDVPESGPQLGLIAQEVRSVIPEVVSTPGADDELLGISYAHLIPVLIRAIQEQQEEIENLKGIVAESLAGR